LPEGHALLALFVTSRRAYGFLMNRDKYHYWDLESSAVLGKKIVGLLRAMGQYEPNRELSVDEIDRADWKVPSQELLAAILKGSKADFSKPFEQLIIVPDGMFWYVPFEALQVEVDGELMPLIRRFQIRYAPTVGLAIPDGRGRKPPGNVAVVTGRLFPHEDPAASRAAFDRIAEVVPGAAALAAPLPAPAALYATLLDRLIVLDDVVAPPPGDPYGWAPIQIDGSKPGNTLGDWLALPWGGPEVVVLPGYHTPAETALKRIGPNGAGTDMFLSVCGLMASGVRTVLISRWRTGGKTSADLIREFVQELPFTTPADAWQRAVLLAQDSRLDLTAEPRIRNGAVDEPPKAAHPFFWAPYMLVDSGSSAAETEKEPAEPVPKFQQPIEAAPDNPDDAEKP
jgi:hypothetical protein